MPTPPTRRELVRLGGRAALAVTAAPLLAACGDGGGAARPEAKSAKVLPHTLARRTGLTPDLAGTSAGVPQGFYTYPAHPPRATGTTPLKGAGTVSVTTETFAPPAPGRPGNAAWRAIEEMLGAQVDVTAVPSDDYPTKFSTMVAGGALPDLFQYPETGGVDDRAAFLRATCADLTPHLAGDRIRAYPNLAAIPRAAWEGCVYGGRLYAIPITRNGTGGAGVYRHDLFAEVGVTDLDQITDLDRFAEVCKELTRPKEGRYALMYNATNLTAMCAGSPKDWRMDARTGRFTHRLETEEFRTSVQVQRHLYQAGCYYPGSIGMANQKARYTDLFKNGKAAYVYDGMAGYTTPSTGYRDAMAAIDRKFDPRPIRPFGRGAVAWTDNVALSDTHLKKGPAARIEQLLHLADFAAAPFGTAEYTLINYGVEHVDFTRDAHGDPTLTKQGTLDVAVPWRMIASAVPAVYMPGSKDGTDYVHDTYRRMIAMLAPDPTLGYSSPTWDSKGYGSLLTLERDGIDDIVTGRRPMSYWTQLTRNYLAAGGEKARREFQEAAQKGKK